MTEDLLGRLKSALADRYQIERELGSGGMATVYLAHDVRHERKVAVKVLRPELAAALGSERFLREIKIAANLNHPHILPLHDSGEADGFLYYVMPYVEGESLRDRLSREKQLPIDDALKIASEVADALGFAHDHNVIHRDIKPENILLEAKHAVVADFGVARAIAEAGETRLTETGIAIGTPAYLSPEQASGERELDGRSDIYALGCVLYEMLAGQAPFTGPTAESIVHQHIASDAPPVTGLRRSVSEAVVNTVTKSLAKAPADRYQRAEALGEAIAAARVSLVTPNGGMTPTDTRPVRTVATWSRKVRIGVAAAAVIIAVIAAALLLPRGRGGAFDPNRVLVVAFADQSGLEETQALGHMAQDYIIQSLYSAGFAEVVHPLTALAVSENVAAEGMATGLGDILALADDAQAGTVVSGSVYAQGDSVHVQTRITDASDGSVMATPGPVVGTIGTLSDLVGRLGQEVVVALAPLLDRQLASLEPTVQPATYEAYEAYNEGLEAYAREEQPEAARHFERAVAADATFARARLWAAQSYFLHSYWGGRPNLASYAKAESLIAPLVESRGQLSRYENCRLDFVMAWGLRGDLSAAYDAARCMVQAAPGSDDAKRELAMSARRLNRPGECIELLRELDPDRGLMKQRGDFLWGWLSGAYHMLGDFEGELEVAREGRQRFPENPYMLRVETRALAALGRLNDVAANLEAMRSLPSREALGGYLRSVAVYLRAHRHRDAAREAFDELIAWYQLRPHDTEELRAEMAFWLYQAERWDDALRLHEELAQEYPENTEYLAVLGRLAARRGDRAEALRISEELRSFRHPLWERNHTLERARIAALLGDREEAMTLLQQAMDLGVQWGHGPWWHRDIDFESLHDYPPFQELIRPKG